MSAPQATGELLIRLGKVASNGQAFELTVGLVLAQSLGISPENGSLVAAQLGVAGTLKLIAGLAKQDGYPLDANAVVRWLKNADQANAGRNRAIHVPWAADSETGEFTSVVERGLKLKPRPLSELDTVATQLHDAILEGQALLKTAG